MQIRRVTVANFRGVQEASWSLPDRRFVCLVGAGDSTKTTLLDAIQLVLGGQRNVTFSDTDFYNCDVSQKIVLQVLLGDLHEGLLADNAFGLPAITRVHHGHRRPRYLGNFGDREYGNSKIGGRAGPVRTEP